MPAQMQHSIDIARSPAEVYAFITQPWHWHHWHPSSRSAKALVSELAVGDSFDEEIVVQPLAPLPPRRGSTGCVAGRCATAGWKFATSCSPR